ncbi:hypothetical protein NKG05_11035 [Oerskovia sp. M15]
MKPMPNLPTDSWSFVEMSEAMIDKRPASSKGLPSFATYSARWLSTTSMRSPRAGRVYRVLDELLELAVVVAARGDPELVVRILLDAARIFLVHLKAAVGLFGYHVREA